MENVKVMSITPEIAEEMLKKNTRNRHVNKQRVLVYAKAMTEGTWALSTDAIGFDTDGVLINGQHRLLAVVKSGVTCQFLVSQGMDKGTVAVIDNGQARNPAHTMQLNGVGNAHNKSALVRRYMLLRDRHRSGNQGRGYLNVDIYNTYLEDADFFNLILAKTEQCYRHMHLMTYSTLGGFMAFLIKEYNYPVNIVYYFFEAVYELRKSDFEIISKLRQRLVNNLTSQTKMTESLITTLVLRAFNIFVMMKKTKNLKVTDELMKTEWFIRWNQSLPINEYFYEKKIF